MKFLGKEKVLEKFYLEFDIRRTVHRDIYNKNQQDAPFLNFILVSNS